MNLTVKDKDGKETSIYVTLASEVQCKLAPARFNIRGKDADYASPAIKTVGTDVEICSSSAGSTPIYAYYGTTTSPTLHFLKNNTEYHCVKNIKWKITNYFNYVPNGGNGSAIKKLIVGNLDGNDAAVTDNIKFLTAAEAGYTRQYYNFVGWLYNNESDRSFGAAIHNSDLNGTKDPTLYAKWVEYYYTLNFNGNNDGSGGPRLESVTLNYSQSYKLPANIFIKTGYTFKRWALNSTSGTAYNDQAIVSRLTTTDKGSVTLYAEWEPITYDITYDLANGEWNDETGASTYNIETATYSPPTPVRTGYDFIGWSPENIPKGSTGNKHFTATWKIHDYNITYNANGGTGGGGPSTYKITDNAVAPTSNPTRTGYTFKGWTPSNIPAGSTGDRTFTAQWEIINYGISYNLNGGGGKLSTAPSSYNITTSVAPGFTPTRTGYTFTVWSPASIAKGSTGAKTFTANWTPTNYSISYDLCGGSISGQQTTYNIESATYTPPNPYKTGYTFTGWTPSAIPKGSTEAKSFKANWSPITYYIAYNANGGSGSVATMTCKYDQTYKLSSSTFKRANWTQVGWSNYSFGQSVKNLTSNDNATVWMYASWEKNYLLPYITSVSNSGISYGSWDYNSWSSWSNGSWGTRTRTKYRNWSTTLSVIVAGGASDVETYATSITTNYGSWSGSCKLMGNSTTISFVISGRGNATYITVSLFRDGNLASSKSVGIWADGYNYDIDTKSAPSNNSSSG